jgi:ABC-type siderophore export system fused ATPase/permease subunit
LKTLQIDQKLKIDQGKLSTTRLSTGQRKRIALLISYLEDRPVYIFDEWAADQDPSFREFFYFSLLPEFKKRGKCVIAITHDNRYFDVADRLIKMEVGKIVE